jgi:hypothetical protein
VLAALDRLLTLGTCCGMARHDLVSLRRASEIESRSLVAHPLILRGNGKHFQSRPIVVHTCCNQADFHRHLEIVRGSATKPFYHHPLTLHELRRSKNGWAFAGSI